MNDVKLLYIHFYIITLRVTSVFQYLDWSILKFTICIQRILRIPVAQESKNSIRWHSIFYLQNIANNTRHCNFDSIKTQ